MQHTKMYVNRLIEKINYFSLSFYLGIQIYLELTKLEHESEMELGMRHISQTKMWKLFGLPSHWPSTTFIVLSSKHISIGNGPKLHLRVIIPGRLYTSIDLP